jgi:glycosyltransferase involved in cell wall biosynthesis
LKILFIFPRPTHYDSRTVRELPSGGTEKAVIFLGEALTKLGHEVVTATTPGQEMPGNVDVVITQHAEFFQHYPDAKKIWWTHHFSDQPIIKEQACWARAYADTIVTLSQCHKQDFFSSVSLDSVVLPHGVWWEEICTTVAREDFRLIYDSTPFRGLERIPGLFAEIKEREPGATIAIASSMRTYGDETGDEQYKGLFDELAAMDGVELLGSLNQEQLYREYARASVFFYPCTWPETYCLALDEAIAHGCIPLVTKLGALPERANWSNFPDDFSPPFAWKRDDSEDFKPHEGIKPKGWIDVAKEWEALF